MRASSISTASSGNGSGSKQKQMAALQGRLRDLERNTAELQLAVQISAEQAAQVKQLGANYGALFMAVQRVLTPQEEEQQQEQQHDQRQGSQTP